MTLPVLVPRRLLALPMVIGLFFGLTAVANAQPGNVAVFDNGAFIDNVNSEGPDIFEAEGPNTIASLQSFGETVTPFTDFSAAGFTAALAGKDSLVIPEEEGSLDAATRGVPQEDPCLDAALTDDAKTVIRNFVSGGGQLVIMAVGEDGCKEELLNDIFTFSLVTSDEKLTASTRGGGPEFFSKTPQAAGTEFQDGPATVGDNNATGVVLESSLPAGARAIYSDGAGDGNAADAVTDIPYGDGSITTLGYDWFNSSPPNPVLGTAPGGLSPAGRRVQTRGGGELGQDFGWQDTLRRSVDLPVLSVNDVSLNEGNSGNTAFGFTVSASSNHSENIKAQFGTGDGTAKAGSDYTAASGTMTQPRFTLSNPIGVNVTGDTGIEPNETFALNLAGPLPAVVGKNGVGTIVNDDFAKPTVGVAGVRRACTSSTVHVRFTIKAGGGVKSVKVTLDGKRVTTTTKSRFTVKVNTKKLRAGRHHLVAIVTDKNGQKTTVRRTIARCAAAKPRHQTGPRFTG
jgi:Calx-beta domain-containing protein/Big-like domain-containing protein